MRACFFPELKKEDEILLTGDQHHHLKNVLRVKQGGEVLLLDGKGSSSLCEIQEIEKKRIVLRSQSFETKEREFKTDLVIGVPKKENLEEIAKSAVMLGVSRLHLVNLEHSPYQFKTSNRFEKIMHSSLEQSNNLFLTEVLTYSSLNEFLDKNSYDLSFICHWGFEPVSKSLSLGNKDVSLFVGPEGGFSEEEVHLLKSQKNICGLSFQTPILRATHACIFGLGFIEAHRHLP